MDSTEITFFTNCTIAYAFTGLAKFKRTWAESRYNIVSSYLLGYVEPSRSSTLTIS